MFQKINDFLDRHVLPWPERFLTNRLVILITIGLLIPLVIYASNTVLVLDINSYLNTMSVAVSSIVLLYATISELRQKQIAEMQEQRAQEDHTHVTEMHALMQRSLREQHRQIEELKQMIASLQGVAYTIKTEPELADLRDLHPRGDERFDDDDVHERVGRLERHALAEGLRGRPSKPDDR